MHLGQVFVDPDGTRKDRGVFGFCAAEVICSGDPLVSPKLEADKRTEQKKIDDKSEILALNKDEEVRRQEMECDNEEQAEQELEKAKTITIQDSPAREIRRSMKRLMLSTEVGVSRA